MNPNDTLPPAPAPAAAGADDAGEAWPSSGPAKGFRVRLPIAIAALVVFGLVGAAGGAAMKKTSSSTTTQSGAIAGNRARGTFGANGAAGATGANGAAGRFGGGGVFGTVTKVEGNTITVSQADGTTATVVVPAGTTITKTVSGSLSDLANGTAIVVRGTTANGKTTAESVTINPAGGAGGFGFGGRNRPNGTTPTTTN